MKKRLFVVLIVVFVIFFLFFAADLFLKDNEPKFYTAPDFSCKTRFKGITLPPVGVFLCLENLEDERIRVHESVHWDQYQRNSSLGFYAKYIWGWFTSGFSYKNHPMEIEARERTESFIR